jgi:bifunctional DNase/RNase
MSLFSKNKKSKKIEIAGIEIAVFELSLKKLMELSNLQAQLQNPETATEATAEMFSFLIETIDQSVQEVSIEDLKDMTASDFATLVTAISGNGQTTNKSNR